MAKSTQAEIEGVPFGAVGIPGPFATQGGLDKVRKLETFANLTDAAAALVAREVRIVLIGAVPNVVAKNAAGTGYKIALTAI